MDVNLGRLLRKAFVALHPDHLFLVQPKWGYADQLETIQQSNNCECIEHSLSHVRLFCFLFWNFSCDAGVSSHACLAWRTTLLTPSGLDHG